MTDEKKEKIVPCIYFAEPGKQNTRRALEIAAEHAERLGLKNILVASTKGEKGLMALEHLSSLSLLC